MSKLCSFNYKNEIKLIKLIKLNKNTQIVANYCYTYNSRIGMKWF